MANPRETIFGQIDRKHDGQLHSPIAAFAPNALVARKTQVMSDFFSNTTVQAGLSVVILCILIAIGFYLVSSYRDYTAQDQEIAEATLESLKELHLKGEISDEEFRTILATTHRHLSSQEVEMDSFDVDHSPSGPIGDLKNHNSQGKSSPT